MLLLPAITKLAGWRFKQMWRFLFVTWLGMLAMVVLVCALPLFSRVAISADLRAVATNAPDGQNIMVQVGSTYPSKQQVQQIAQQVDHVLKQSGLGPYLQGAPRFIVQTPPLDVLPAGNARPGALILDGYDPAEAAPHVALVHGRLPQVTTDNTVEIALTQQLASSLRLHVNSTIQGHYPVALGSQVWTMQVVGIIAPASASDSFWLKATSPFGTRYTQNSGATAYSVLAASETVSAKIATLQATTGSGVKDFQDSFHLIWSYPFDLSHLDANNVTALSQQASDLRWQMNNSLTRIEGVSFALPFGSLFEAVSGYAQQIVVLGIVITFLLLLTLALVLFLVGMLSDMLVERQSAVIATLRSRGATRRHVFGAFVAQGIVLSLVALLVGPLLAILLVREIAQILLTPANQQSLSVITSNPIQATLAVKWYALVAVVVALFVIIVAISRASKLDIVSLRRDSSRTKRVSLWRRLNLDLLVVLLIVVGYIAYVYFWQSLSASQSFNSILYDLLKGLAFIAPPLFVAAVFMLFLRLFPWILRMATSLAAKKRSASTILAFAQMERTPRPAARIVILLALAIAASCFLFTLMTTKQERTSDAATFAVGADFSGLLSASDATKTFDALKTQYSSMSGVQSATLGYYNSIQAVNDKEGPTRLVAVDADTYAHTALWSTQNSSQSLSSLNAQLVTHRADATAHDVVYALVDAALWQRLHLTQGEQFSLPINDSGTPQAHFIALAQISYIPGLYDTPLAPDQSVGLLVDYQSYAAVYAKESGTTLSPNFVWLRTHADAASLASLRHALPNLQDRRILTTDNQENSVHLDIIGVLVIGVGAALILALIGTLLSSWLDASNRRTNFAVARAIGMAPRQIAAVLLWEQGFIYVLAFLLGTGMGAMLTIFAAPIVSLLDLAGPVHGNLYDVPSVQSIIPYPQLTLLLGGLGIICLVALLLMARIVSRPSISQILRLNED